MQKKKMPSLNELTGGRDVKHLKRIAKSIEYRIYISQDGKYVIKIPTLFTRLLGIADIRSVSGNVDRCKNFIAEHKLPIEIPATIVQKNGGSFVIIQEFIDGEHDKKSDKELVSNIKLPDIEENYIDFTPNNIVYHGDKAYLIDTSDGFYYKFARKYGKAASRILWHMLQIAKLFFRESNKIHYQENKIYYHLEFADFLKSLRGKNKTGNKFRILYWHLIRIYRLLFNYSNDKPRKTAKV